MDIYTIWSEEELDELSIKEVTDRLNGYPPGVIMHKIRQLGHEAEDLLPKVTACIAHIEETLINLRRHNNGNK